MNVRVVQASELTQRDISCWNELQRRSAAFRSPYFHPEFARSVGRVRPQASVAVLERNDGPAGFFPFHRDSSRTASPLAGTLTDFQGAVVDPGEPFCFAELVRQCGLAAWRFDHLVPNQSESVAVPVQCAPSRYLDLSQGFAAYTAARQQAGSKVAASARRSLRKLEREAGPLRFEFHTPSDSHLDFIFRNKVAQYHRIGSVDHLAPKWTRQLLRDICFGQHQGFQGVLSVLYAGDQLAAAHLGMRTADTLHYWYPTHNPELEKYSPGLVLLFEIARMAADDGITRFDLGKGEEAYKARFASGETLLAEGSVDLRPIMGAVCRGAKQTRNWVRDSRLRGCAERIVRGLRTCQRKITLRGEQSLST